MYPRRVKIVVSPCRALLGPLGPVGVPGPSGGALAVGYDWLVYRKRGIWCEREDRAIPDVMESPAEMSELKKIIIINNHSNSITVPQRRAGSSLHVSVQPCLPVLPESCIRLPITALCSYY